MNAAVDGVGQIGSLGLEEAERHGIDEKFGDKKGRELGYVLSKDYWGRGLMPEAVKRVIQYAFEDQGWDFLLCGHYNENHQSRREIVFTRKIIWN